MAQNVPEVSITLREFLESIPPGSQRRISDIGKEKNYQYSGGVGTLTGAKLHRPEILLHCDGAACGGLRVFICRDPQDLVADESRYLFMKYLCKNCTSYTKTFALLVRLDKKAEFGSAFKVGENPQFGPPLPSRLISLLRDERELLVKGRRCENQGLGVAAFAYYRRVVEAQKGKIFDEIIRVANLLPADKALVGELQAAKGETQFHKAISLIKHAVPDGLLINGQNPLMLLHDALSQGLHAETDEECLEVATDIRVVMAEFAERLAQAVKDDAELTSAVTRLIRKRAEREQKKKDEGLPS